VSAGVRAVPVPSSPRWQERAACRGADPELFFPERGRSADPARRICARCPVRQPCLEYALGHGIRDGIWGGLAERDRRELRARYMTATRRQRDLTIAAAAAAGYTKAAIGRAFGVAATSVNRAVSGQPGRRGRS
jgi:WhiB family redox-sensing transcriptional regulator